MSHLVEQESSPSHSKAQQLIDAVKSTSQPMPVLEAPGGETVFFMPEFAEISQAHDFLKGFDAAKAKELFAKKSEMYELLDDDASLKLAKRINAIRGLYRPETIRLLFKAFQIKDMPMIFSVLATHWTADFSDSLARSADEKTLRALVVPLAIADHIERGVGIEEMDACLRSLRVITESSGPTPKDRVTMIAGERIVEQARVMDVDEQDFEIPSYLRARLSEKGEALSSAFESALSKNDVQAFFRVVGALYGTEQSTEVIEVIEDDFSDLVRWRKSAEARLDALAETLPVEARELHVYNARFDRTRKIAPFSRILMKKISKSLFAFFLADVRHATEKTKPLKTIWEKADVLLDEALSVYRSVHERGVPEFQKFAEYLSEHAKEGEFHVGRDTKTTTFIASHANRWGTMTGEERHAMIKHVNISRPLLGSSPRVLLKYFLKQEGVNERMMGIDGGYMGTNPQRALLALNPELKKSDLNQQVKLFSADASVIERQFDPEAEYHQFVSWMEGLPKYTDRMQHLEAKEVKGVVKMLGSTKSRSPAEQLLAWVVQHAVWRGTIPKKVLESKERVGDQAVVKQKHFADIIKQGMKHRE